LDALPAGWQHPVENIRFRAGFGSRFVQILKILSSEYPKNFYIARLSNFRFRDLGSFFGT
jgi:hypothetical protein